MIRFGLVWHQNIFGILYFQSQHLPILLIFSFLLLCFIDKINILMFCFNQFFFFLIIYHFLLCVVKSNFYVSKRMFRAVSARLSAYMKRWEFLRCWLIFGTYVKQQFLQYATLYESIFWVIQRIFFPCSQTMYLLFISISAINDVKLSLVISYIYLKWILWLIVSYATIRSMKTVLVTSFLSYPFSILCVRFSICQVYDIHHLKTACSFITYKL